ncbi:MAG: hypothetical protein RLY93_20695 [Sumerlaeia bacterium]
MTAQLNGDAVSQIADLAAKHQMLRNRTFTVASEPADVYYLVKDDGSVERKQAEMPPQKVEAFSVEDILRRLGDSDGAPLEIYYHKDGLTAVAVVDGTSGAQREERHAMKFPKTTMFGLVSRMKDDPATFYPSALVHFLRTKLRGAVDETVVENLRHVKSSRSAEGEELYKIDTKGFGRRATSQVHAGESGGALPEEIVVNLSVYNLPEVREKTYPVRLVVESSTNDDGRALIELTAVEADLEQACHDALLDVVAPILAQDKVRHYHARLA